LKDNISITQVSLLVPEGSKVIVVEDKPLPQEIRPKYYSIGNGLTMTKNVPNIDFINELIKLSKPAQTVVGWVVDRMKWDIDVKGIAYEVRIVPKTSAEAQVLKKGFKELSEKDLMRRSKRSHYVINPYALFSGSFEDHLKLWRKIEPTEELKTL
jgi:hypothetical protein